nr:MAG TPA: hypothetical protein [Caudoviricetes sp.]
MSAPTAWQLLYCWRVDMRKLTNKKNTHTADQLSNLHRGFSKNSDRWHRLRPALAYFHSKQDNGCQISYKTNDFSQSRKVNLHRVLLSTSSWATGFSGSPYDNVHMFK